MMMKFRRDTRDRLERIECKLDHLLYVVRTGNTAALAAISQEGDTIMSALSDKIAVVGTAIDDEAARILATQAALQAKIDALQATIDAGGASAADLAALDALKTKLDQIDPATPSVVPTP